MDADAALRWLTPRRRLALRLALLLSFFLWLLVPPLRHGVSMWVPFAALAGVEAHFFATGALARWGPALRARGSDEAAAPDAPAGEGAVGGEPALDPRARGDLMPAWRLEREAYVVVDDPLAGDLEDAGPDAAAGGALPDAWEGRRGLAGTGWAGSWAGRRAAAAGEAAALALLVAWLAAGAVRDALPALLILAACSLAAGSFVARVWEEAGFPQRLRHPLAPWLRRAAGLAALGVLVFLLVRPTGWDALPRAEQARAEAAFTRQASIVAGKPVHVACDAAGKRTGVINDADGLAEVGGTRAWLAPRICIRLHDLWAHGRRDSFDATSWAILVLAHESWHLRGSGNEGVTDCYGLQSGVGVGTRLGLPAAEAARMMRYRWERAESEFSLGRAQYMLPQGCAEGGRYDLDASSSRFP